MLVSCNILDLMKHELEGTWEMYSVESVGYTIYADNTFSYSLIFYADETCFSSAYVSGEYDSGTGTWSTDGNILTIITDNDTSRCTYEVTGETLHLDFDVEGSMVLHKQ